MRYTQQSLFFSLTHRNLNLSSPYSVCVLVVVRGLYEYQISSHLDFGFRGIDVMMDLHSWEAEEQTAVYSACLFCLASVFAKNKFLSLSPSLSLCVCMGVRERPRDDGPVHSTRVTRNTQRWDLFPHGYRIELPPYYIGILTANFVPVVFVSYLVQKRCDTRTNTNRTAVLLL